MSDFITPLRSLFPFNIQTITSNLPVPPPSRSLEVEVSGMDHFARRQYGQNSATQLILTRNHLDISLQHPIPAHLIHNRLARNRLRLVGKHGAIGHHAPLTQHTHHHRLVLHLLGGSHLGALRHLLDARKHVVAEHLDFAARHDIVSGSRGGVR